MDQIEQHQPTPTPTPQHQNPQQAEHKYPDENLRDFSTKIMPKNPTTMIMIPMVAWKFQRYILMQDSQELQQR